MGSDRYLVAMALDLQLCPQTVPVSDLSNTDLLEIHWSVARVCLSRNPNDELEADELDSPLYSVSFSSRTHLFISSQACSEGHHFLCVHLIND